MRALAAIVVLAFVFTYLQSEEWTGYVYPDKTNLSRYVKSGTFDSLENCRWSSIQVLKAGNNQLSGDYECGLNCEIKSGLNVCKETTR